jgi:hypothetical protein
MRIRWEFPAKHHPQWGNHDLLPSDRPHETNISSVLVSNLSLKITMNWKPHANLGSSHHAKWRNLSPSPHDLLMGSLIWRERSFQLRSSFWADLYSQRRHLEGDHLGLPQMRWHNAQHLERCTHRMLGAWLPSGQLLDPGFWAPARLRRRSNLQHAATSFEPLLWPVFSRACDLCLLFGLMLFAVWLSWGVAVVSSGIPWSCFMSRGGGFQPMTTRWPEKSYLRFLQSSWSWSKAHPFDGEGGGRETFSRIIRPFSHFAFILHVHFRG